MKTRRPLTPLERAMDRATGYEGDSTAPVLIRLRCRHCGKEQSAPADETDPEGTAIVECLCPDCDDGGLKPEVHYYDAAGRWFNGEAFVVTT